jgi:uncharacterized membrane-anchored protein YitT (DUF2179 family)
MFFSLKKGITNNIMKTIYSKNRIRRYTSFVLGVFIMAVSFNLFFLPNNIVYGGVSGISIILRDIVDPSLFIFITSIILLMTSFLLLGKEKTAKTVIGTLLFPIFVNLTANFSVFVQSFANIKTDDLLLVAVFGGLLSGFGAGLIFKAGFTTGGTDIINQIMAKYFKISIGKSMIIIDGLIVLSGVLAFKDWTLVMYAIIVLYIISMMADKVILGISESKAFYIITDKQEEVKGYILENLGHSVTVFDAKGGFSGEKEKVLMCVIPTKEYFKFKEGIELIDNEAFFVVTDAYEVSGGK